MQKKFRDDFALMQKKHEKDLKEKSEEVKKTKGLNQKMRSKMSLAENDLQQLKKDLATKTAQMDKRVSQAEEQLKSKNAQFKTLREENQKLKHMNSILKLRLEEEESLKEKLGSFTKPQSDVQSHSKERSKVKKNDKENEPWLSNSAKPLRKRSGSCYSARSSTPLQVKGGTSLQKKENGEVKERYTRTTSDTQQLNSFAGIDEESSRFTSSKNEEESQVIIEDRMCFCVNSDSCRCRDRNAPSTITPNS